MNETPEIFNLKKGLKSRALTIIISALIFLNIWCSNPKIESKKQPNTYEIELNWDIFKIIIKSSKNTLKINARSVCDNNDPHICEYAKWNKIITWEEYLITDEHPEQLIYTRDTQFNDNDTLTNHKNNVPINDILAWINNSILKHEHDQNKTVDWKEIKKILEYLRNIISNK